LRFGARPPAETRATQHANTDLIQCISELGKAAVAVAAWSAERRVQKHHTNTFTFYFLQKKDYVENLFQKNRQKFRCQMSVFPRFFLFYRGFGCFSVMGVQKHSKTRCTKKSCRFKKKSTKKSKTDFFSVLFSRFWAFLGERSKKKHHNKM
jgi:hypothetical protein